jgi:hypothetical protein
MPIAGGADSACVLALAIGIGIIVWIAAHAYGRRPAEDGGNRTESAFTRDVGPRANWPWLSPGLGLLSLLIAVLSAGLAHGAPPQDGGDCLDVCVAPSGPDLLSGARGVAFAAAAAAGIFGALALRDPSARVVGVAGLTLAATAALVALVAV